MEKDLRPAVVATIVCAVAFAALAVAAAWEETTAACDVPVDEGASTFGCVETAIYAGLSAGALLAAAGWLGQGRRGAWVTMLIVAGAFGATSLGALRARDLGDAAPGFVLAAFSIALFASLLAPSARRALRPRRTRDDAPAWPALAALGAGAVAAMAAIAVALAIIVWHAPFSDPATGLAFYGGFVGGVLALTFGAITQAHGRFAARGSVAIGAGAIGLLAALVAAGLAFTTPIPEQGDILADGSCQGRHLRVVLTGVEGHNVTFEVTSIGPHLNASFFSWRSRIGDVPMEADWDVAPHATQSVTFVADAEVGAWRSYRLGYAVVADDSHRGHLLQCQAPHLHD